MRNVYAKSPGFVSTHAWELVFFTSLAAGLALVVAGLYVNFNGRRLPNGEIYDCDETSFDRLLPEKNPKLFYRMLESDCQFLVTCQKAQLFIANLVCMQACEQLFESAPVVNITGNNCSSILVRTCAANEYSALANMLLISGGAILFCILLRMVFYSSAVIQDASRLWSGIKNCCAKPSEPDETAQVSGYRAF